MPTKKPAARDRQTGRNSARSAGKKGAGSNAGESSPRMQVEQLPIADLHYDPANVRKHGERNLQIIRSSLARFGQQRPILVDATNVVRAGNGTLQAARELGWESILCVRTDLTGSEAIAYAIADNRSAELAEWEDGLLGQQLQGLLDDGIDLDAVGFSEDEIDALVKELNADNEVLADAIGGLPDGEKSPFQKMTFTLTDDQAEAVKQALEAAKEAGDFVGTGNENSNGNALARIAEAYNGRG